ncbi:hypothetical protein [Umezawaea sp. Da 62-37]|uniref:hypothetical protein n=1 Tax=Umezawaea sp. Da 62-37 TaxID=3075927 RepID=UPI0028F6E787|nr:hypothetical protein [Umezawaea sp. Da 62-37]WNV85270.1 hypothetical protein RM788_45320 [Umezawaea sp. Da 62-37]
MVRLLDNGALERSSVVANCTMNRERGLTGSNGYGRELGVDVIDLITDRLSRGAETFHWLDLCCGTGTALLECARLVDDPRLSCRSRDVRGTDRWPGRCGRRGSTTTRDDVVSGASGTGRSTCRSGTSAPTIRPAPTTPANRR